MLQFTRPSSWKGTLESSAVCVNKQTFHGSLGTYVPSYSGALVFKLKKKKKKFWTRVINVFCTYSKNCIHFQSPRGNSHSDEALDETEVLLTTDNVP